MIGLWSNIFSRNIFILSILLLTNINLLFAGDLSNYTPHQVVGKFCSLNAEAKSAGLESPYWKLVAWGDEGGWDQCTMISKFEIKKEKINGTNAEVKVKYFILAFVIGGTEFWPKGDSRILENLKSFKYPELIKVTQDGNIEVTYKLIKTDKVWKIDRPVLPPFEYKETVINNQQENIDLWRKEVEKGNISKSLLFYMRERKKGIDSISFEEMYKEEVKIQDDFISSLKSMH